jgi:beta-glucanase (GH16 family)
VAVLVLALTLPLLLAPASAQSDASKSRVEKRTGGSGSLVSLPPIVQPGTAPASPSNAGQVVATFEPARAGRPVLLERRTGNTWRQVARKRQDAWGSAAFAVQPGTYRARTDIGLDREVLTGRVVSRAWTPAFEDTFSGAALDSAVWNDQRREHESVYAPRTCARTDPSTRRVEGGVLHLGIALDPERLDQRCQYTTDEGAGEQSYLLTSQVATEHTRLFRHGIAAARMKPQKAKGMHSSFWLLPEGTRFTDGDPSAGTEIDVMEFFGVTPRGRETIGSFVSYYEPGWHNVKHGALFREARQALGQGARWWEEFHVFSVEWTPEHYIFRIDGREYHRETNAVSLAQQYLVLSMLASDHELAELTADELDDTAQVDWVRVYDATSRTSR